MTSIKELATHSPTLKRLLKTRLAPIREDKLVAAALSPTKPVKPPAGECCGSSCNPCVMDLYREELLVWKECVRVREDEGVEARGEEAAVEQVARGKIPGAYEW